MVVENSAASATPILDRAVLHTLTFEKGFQDLGEALWREQTLLDVFDDEAIERGHWDMPALAF